MTKRRIRGMNFVTHRCVNPDCGLPISAYEVLKLTPMTHVETGEQSYPTGDECRVCLRKSGWQLLGSEPINA